MKNKIEETAYFISKYCCIMTKDGEKIKFKYKDVKRKLELINNLKNRLRK